MKFDEHQRKEATEYYARNRWPKSDAKTLADEVDRLIRRPEWHEQMCIEYILPLLAAVELMEQAAQNSLHANPYRDINKEIHALVARVKSRGK